MNILNATIYTVSARITHKKTGLWGGMFFWIQLPTNDCFTAILTFYVFVMKFYGLWFMHVKTRLTSSRPNMKDGTATVASQQLVRDLL